MSLMKRLLGQKQKKESKQDQTKKVNEAITKLKEHIVILNKRKAHSEKQIKIYNKSAQQCLKNKNRKGALSKIKLRKQVEKRLETLENQIFNLEVQIMALEETMINRAQMEAMKISAQAMKVENPDQMIEDVEQTQDDIQEALDLQKEFNDLMGTPLIDYDDDELEMELAELDELDDDIMNDQLLYSKKKKVQPEMKSVDEEEEEEEEEEVDHEAKEIKKLEMEMNLKANDRHIIDVQIVETSSPMLIASC